MCFFLKNKTKLIKNKKTKIKTKANKQQTNRPNPHNILFLLKLNMILIISLYYLSKILK
jgi:hypothetical protein